jgi:DisA bacterial checkpoint controller nucleotide-binding
LTVPPALAVGALYDSVLQSALRQFFERASLDTEVTPSVSSDGRLSIEPSANPAALIIRWFGTRYTLRVPGRWAFTAHEVRLAQAIGAVLAARYSAILNPRIIAERNDLFRGMIEDRYVGSFLDYRPYAIEAREARADRIASVIELLRVAALSSYENRPISTGVLLLGTSNDPCRPDAPLPATAPSYTESTTAIKSLFRLADGVRTVFLANAEGRLLDIIDIERWGSQVSRHQTLQVPCAKAYQPHARATLQQGHVCAVLTPSREIKIFAEGAEIFTFRGAAWHLLDLQAKYRLWAEGVGDEALAMRIFQTALDLADAREGALFVVARDTNGVAKIVAPADRLDVPHPDSARQGPPSRRDLLELLEGRSLTDLDPNVLAALASLDGAIVVDPNARLLAAGAILRHPPSAELEAGVVEGARTTAALAASKFGPVLKVSEDGIITFFDGEKVWDI